MQSEVLESVNESAIGIALSNFAQNSFYMQLRYQPTEKFAFGGDVTYKSERWTTRLGSWLQKWHRCIQYRSAQLQRY